MDTGLFKAILGPIFDGVLRFIPDKNKRAEAAEQFEGQILNAMTGLVAGQLKINEREAQHGSVFVAGARPFLLWVCGFAFAWQFVLQPMGTWFVLVIGADLPPLPMLDFGPLMTLTLGMLGLGGLRTYEKRIGVARKDIKK
jgi:hypothetical protein